MSTIEKLFWILIIIGTIISIYLDYFVCGGLTGKFSDIPRWCWWLR